MKSNNLGSTIIIGSQGLLKCYRYIKNIYIDHEYSHIVTV